MLTLAVIGGAAALCVAIGYNSGKNNSGDPAGPIGNNPFSEWESNQPYNP